MKLLRRCNAIKYLNMAYNLKQASGEKCRFEGNATLRGRADCTKVFGGQWNVSAGAVVPVFQYFGMTRPDRIVHVIVRRQPDADTQHLADDETDGQYSDFAHLSHIRRRSFKSQYSTLLVNNKFPRGIKYHRR